MLSWAELISMSTQHTHRCAELASICNVLAHEHSGQYTVLVIATVAAQALQEWLPVCVCDVCKTGDI